MYDVFVFTFGHELGVYPAFGFGAEDSFMMSVNVRLVVPFFSQRKLQ